MQLLFKVTTNIQTKFIFIHKKLLHVSAKHVVRRLAETCSSLLCI